MPLPPYRSQTAVDDHEDPLLLEKQPLLPLSTVHCSRNFVQMASRVVPSVCAATMAIIVYMRAAGSQTLQNGPGV